MAVDYDEVGKLHHVLESNSVHTVVSTINVSSPESGVAEHNLVEAAALSKSTKRFISSDFAVRIPES